MIVKGMNISCILTMSILPLFVACSTMPRQNQPLDHYSKRAGYRFSNLSAGENNSDSLFVVLTFSGGGPRAAAFALGVLEKLRDTEILWEGNQRSLLNEVDVISSVSGGSLTAAYYGLFRERIFDDFADDILSRNFTTILIKDLIAVNNWAKLASANYSRSNLMAEKLMDGDIFEQQTFADLLRKNRRPFIVINATDMSLGRRFAFTQEQFDLLYSDLSSYPVGYAVVASGAFPGVLTPLTLNNYDNAEDYEPPGWVQKLSGRSSHDDEEYLPYRAFQSYVQTGRPYIHLVDGGVSDNLGLLPVILAFDGRVTESSIKAGIESGEIKKVVIITVNARMSAHTDWDNSSEPPSMSTVLKQTGLAPMGNYSQALIQYLRLFIKSLSEEHRLRERIKAVLAEQGVDAELPELETPKTECHFIEVAFNQLVDEEERDNLSKISTFARLEKEDIDRLRSAAVKILDSNQGFLHLMKGLE